MNAIYEQRKIACPTQSLEILHREELLTRLHEAIVGTGETPSPYRLVLLCAPAGYGKTTLLADFARQTHFPCCWYFLDHTDNDKINFLTYLLASIRQRFPRFGHTVDTLLTSAIATGADYQATFDWHTVEEALDHALSTEITGRFALLLCNYHEVNQSQPIRELVNLLLRKLPEQCVLVIESRAMPDLELAWLLARREMTGINAAMLRLHPEEVRKLACIQGTPTLSEQEAEQLARSFDGWIAGILLGTRLGGTQFLQARSDELREATDPQFYRQHLFDYVVNEVFKHKPALYSLLKDISPFTEITPSVCSALLDLPDTSERLQQLEQQGMFVTHSGEGQHITYSCHPVLRELLYDEFRKQDPERCRTLHRKAADLFSVSRDYERAIAHALAAEANESAARLIIESAEEMLNQGRVETLARWIAALPDTCAHSPRLLLLRANLALMEGDLYKAQPFMEEAEQLVSTEAASPALREQDPTLQSEIALTRSLVMYRQGDYQRARDLCQQVLAELSVDEIKLRTLVFTRLGACANAMGDLQEGIAYLQKALQLWGRHTLSRQTAEAHFGLAVSYCLLANFALAEHHILRARTCYEHLDDQHGKIKVLLRLGGIKQYQGMLTEAETAYTKALTIASNTPRFHHEQAKALLSLGILAIDQMNYERALSYLEDGLAIIQKNGDKFLLNCGLAMQAMSYLNLGDEATARQLLTEIDAPPASADSISYERAQHDLVYGMLLLRQERYDEAYAHLTKLESVLRKSGPKPELFLATLQLAACLVAQDKFDEAAQRLEGVADTLLIEDKGEAGIHNELRRLPALVQAIKTRPEMARLRGLLRMETGQETPAVVSPTASPQPRLRIMALGEPAVLLDGKRVTRWRMARAMELFFYLLDYGRPVNKELLLDALWPEFDEQVKQTFRSTIYYLRKAVGETTIIAESGLYSLNLEENAWYDVAAFEEQRRLAARMLAGNDEGGARTALQAMIRLYRGDYVQSFYSDWCTFRRDELRRAYLDARRQLAELAWRGEQFDESAAHWQHILAVDECLEEAHYWLMRCFLRQGKRGLALRQYQRCRDILQHELSIQPGQAIQSLYQGLKTSPFMNKR